jgi:hypothetical protein
VLRRERLVYRFPDLASHLRIRTRTTGRAGRRLDRGDQIGSHTLGKVLVAALVQKVLQQSQHDRPIARLADVDDEPLQAAVAGFGLAEAGRAQNPLRGQEQFPRPRAPFGGAAREFRVGEVEQETRE